jgi:polygalacturonase
MVASPFARDRCSVTEFGAVGDNRTVSTDAFRAAVLACGTVLVPAGVFVTGAFNLTSHQRLELDADAVIAAVYGANNTMQYPRRPGVPPFGHHPGNIPSFRTRPSALVSARHAVNVSIVGAGGAAYARGASVIDGLGWHWHGPGFDFTNTFSLVEFFNCTDVYVAGVTVANAATWSVHPFDCEDVHFRNVSVVGPRWMGGVSGIHPDSTRNALIEDCFVDVGDDGIVVASYHDFYGVPKPAANITVRRCTVLSRNIAIGAGTATSSSKTARSATTRVRPRGPSRSRARRTHRPSSSA